MTEYIDREAAIKLVSDACAECREGCEEFDGIYADCNQCIMHSVVKGLPTIPAAEVRPVVHGKWIEAHAISGHDFRRCSECGTYIESVYFANDYNVNFCPCCGADMRRVDDT